MFKKIFWCVLPLVLVVTGIFFFRIPPKTGAGLAAKTLGTLEKAGQIIFLQGMDPSGKAIVGVWEGSDFEVSGSTIACAKCHGMTGKGGEEGGLSAPDIRAHRLFQKRAADRMGQGGREALDELSLKTVITQGFAPGGRQLHQAMPRFALNEDQWKALYAYLKVMGQTTDPGLSHDIIRIGIAEGEYKSFSTMIQAYFDFVNERGGVYRRRIELSSRNEVENFLQLGHSSAVTMDDMQPVLLATDGTADYENPARALSYFLHPGPYFQAAASLEFAHRNFSKPVLLIAGDDQEARAWIQGARSESLGRGQGEPRLCTYQADGSGVEACAERAKGSVVLFQGREDHLSGLIRWLKKEQIEVPLLAYGENLRHSSEWIELIRGQQNFCVSTSHSLVDSKKPIKLDFISFLKKQGRTQPLSELEIQAWSLASLIEEVLIRAGTDLTRLGFLEAIEQIRYFQAGPSAPLTFSKTQKVGSQGAYITCAGAGSQFVESWIGVIR